MNQDLWTAIVENVLFIVQFLGIVAGLFIVAYIVEKINKKKSGDKERILSTRKIAFIGMFSAIAAVLHIFDFPVFFAPEFYRLDFSELPALVGTFAFGPAAGVMIEFCKIVLKLITKGTSTAFVGDLANFIVGCSFLLPASIIYSFRKSKKSAIIGCIAGTVCITMVGTVLNIVYLIPKFSQLFMPLDKIIDAGRAINPAISNLNSFALFAVAPMNVIKGSVASLITMLIYKKLSPILKETSKKSLR